MNSKGRVTIPTDIDVIEQTKEIAAKWGADALRDCDGTDFPQELKDSGLKVYSTYYTTRKDNEWAKQNPDEAFDKPDLWKNGNNLCLKDKCDYQFFEG